MNGTALRALACSAAFVAALAHAGGRVHTVRVEGMKFAPERLEVAAGDTIIWTNQDPVPHTITAKKARIESGDIAPGRSWKFTARRKGEIDYICSVHPVMHGSIIVK